MNGVAVIGAPSSIASFSAGQELGPTALRHAGLLEALETKGLVVQDFGDAPLQTWTTRRDWYSDDLVAAIVQGLSVVRSKVAEAREQQLVPLVIGGSCLSLLPVLAASDPVPVVYVDHHFDLNLPSELRGGALDWTGMAHALDVEGCVRPLSRAFSDEALLDVDRLVHVAVNPQECGPKEWQRAKELGVRWLLADAVSADPTKAAEELSAAVGNPADGVLLHLDVDAVDFFDLPLAENYSRSDAVRLDGIEQLLAAVAAQHGLSGVVVAEINPNHDPEGDGTRKLVDLLSSTLAVGLHGERVLAGQR